MITVGGEDYFTECNYTVEALADKLSQAVSLGATRVLFTIPQCGIDDRESVSMVFRRNETEEETKTRWEIYRSTKREQDLAQLAYLKKKYEGVC